MTAYATTVPLWQPTHAYLVGSRVQPTAQDQTVFACTVAGLSGTTEPTWATSEPWTNTDGTVTWQKSTSFRRQVVAGLYDLLVSFQQANPSMLNSVSPVRPKSIASLALPAAYIGSRDESITDRGQLQERTMSPQIVIVDSVPDNAQAAARADDLVDGLIAYIADNFHAASGFSIVSASAVNQTTEDDGPTTYLANVISLGNTSVVEG